jgi:hypothetical protein
MAELTEATLEQNYAYTVAKFSVYGDDIEYFDEDVGFHHEPVEYKFTVRTRSLDSWSDIIIHTDCGWVMSIDSPNHLITVFQNLVASCHLLSDDFFKEYGWEHLKLGVSNA